MRTALFPLAPGSYAIEPINLQASALVGQRGGADPFESFFFQSQRAKRIRLTTKPITIHVKALPHAGKVGAFTGLVGKFQMRHQLSRRDLAVGDSATLTVSIEGVGNVRDAKIPAPSSSRLKLYEDEPVFEMGQNGEKIQGKKTFKWALVPLEPGSVAIPPVEMAYFNPETRAYEWMRAAFPELQVVPGTGEKLSLVTAPSVGSQKQKIEVLGKDLMPIRRSLTALRQARWSSNERVLFLVGLGFFPLFYAAAWLFRKRREKIRKDTGYSRRTKAYKTFRKGVRRLEGDGKFYEQASSLLRAYLGNRLNMEGGALTSVDVERKLKDRLSSQARDRVSEYLKQCEQGQYGGVSLGDKSKSMKSELKGLVKHLEREWR